MQYSDTSGKQGLIQDITFLLGVDTNNYTIADRTRNINTKLDLVWTMIFEAYGGWKFMDDNQSDATTGVPYADQTITSGTGLYVIPTSSITIEKILFKNAASGPWQQLTPLTHEEFFAMGADAMFPSNGLPTYYLLQGDVIRLLPVPNFTVTSALRVFFEKPMTAFTTADTTAVPGFASIFHRILSIGAALDYASSRGMTNKIAYLSALWNDYEHRLRLFYEKRYKQRFPSRIGSGQDLVEEFR